MTPSYPVTAPYAPVQLQEPISPMQRVACGIWLIELAIFYSRFFDIVASRMHIPGVFLVLLIFSSLMSGKILRGFGNKAGRSMGFFVAWVTLTLVFSIWKTGSIPDYEALLFSLLYFSVIAGVLPSLKHIRQTMTVLAFSLLAAALMSFMFGSYRSERLVLEVGTYGDPNQYAMCVIMGVPLMWYVASTAKNSFAKILCYMATLPMFWVFFKTGSRGGLIGLLGMLGVLFLQSSVSRKIMLVGAVALGVLLVGITMPDYIQKRYRATFGVTPGASLQNTLDSGSTVSGETADYLKADSESAEGRKQLLYKSIEITIRNPIFGVGPGNFPAAVFADAQQNKEHYAWFVTHNSYTQISSETGIPGLILFLCVVIYSFKNVNNVLRVSAPGGSNPRPELWKAAFYLRLSLIEVCACMFFLSCGYTAEIYVLTGLTVALDRIHRLAPAPVASVGPAAVIQAGFKGQRQLVPELPRPPRWARPHTI